MASAIVISCSTIAQDKKTDNNMKTETLFKATSMQQLLKTAKEKKKPVTLVLKNGNNYTGYVSDVGEMGESNVALTELSGKEFYNALIRLEDISAIEIRKE